MDLNAVFVDGGSQSNTPINPIVTQQDSSKKKKTIVVSLSDLHLDTVNHHLLDVTKGLISCPEEESASINFLLPPRREVLITTASLSHPINNEKMWLALCAIKTPRDTVVPEELKDKSSWMRERSILVLERRL